MAPLLIFLLLCSSSSAAPSVIYRGTSVSVDQRGSGNGAVAALVSPSSTFTCGFYPVGDNAFTFAIWFTNARDSAVVWTANRDRHVNGHSSAISLQKDGSLVLTDTDGSQVWSAGTGADKAELLDSGNLVLKSQSDDAVVVWESFASPTDTLLPGQPLANDTKLVSGAYSLYFDNDNVLRLIFTSRSPAVSSIYWPNPDNDPFRNSRNPYNGSKVAVLDDLGHLSSSDGFTAQADDSGAGISRRITLDYDGNVRMYSLNRSNGKWVVTWKAIQNMCLVHGLCGQNGICGYSPVLRCSCPPGYDMTDPEDWNKGCSPKFSIAASCSEGRQQYKFVKFAHTDFYGFDLNYNQSISYGDCMKECRESCACLGFGYRSTGTGVCYPKALLFNGYTSPSFPGSTFLKIQVHVNSSSSMDYQQPCNNGSWKTVAGSLDMYKTDGGSSNWSTFFIFASILGSLELFIMLVGWYYLFHRQNIPKSLVEGYRVISSNFRRFTYRELKEATRNFKEELGRGGSGTVYRGVLDDTRVIAVKKLANVKQGEEQFWAEMTVIGRINHINLVKMWGFCSERTHRLLVFEYVENESLNKYLFGNVSIDRLLNWKQRFKVAVGTAKGLAYLHHECLEWVVHCDMKPENILLTRDFEAKIADFGLAKLFKRDGPSSSITQMRGTRGYMAPEWAMNIPVNAKVDVYSYGVVLLEIVTGRRISEARQEQSRISEVAVDLSNISEVILEEQSMIVQEVSEDQRGANMTSFVQDLRRLLANEEESPLDIVDLRLNGQFDAPQAKTMLKIALSCLEEDRRRRPTMDEVVTALIACDRLDVHPVHNQW